MKTSKLEDSIIYLLKEANISMHREFEIQDLRNGKMKFDFMLPEKNIFIEVNGTQHYEFKKYFFKSKTDFLKAQERDRIKIAYALSHNIDMYIYPYFDMPQTTDDLFLEKYHAHSKFHNDTVWRLYQMGQY